MQATAVSILWLVSGVRARAFVAVVASIAVAWAAINLWVSPLAGQVTGLRQARLPWGEAVVVADHGPGSWLLGLAHVMAVGIQIFGFIGAARMWDRDRAGALAAWLKAKSEGRPCGRPRGMSLEAPDVRT